MNCQECEASLGMDAAAEVEVHLAGCAACRELADEIRANAAAFEGMGIEAVPSVRAGVTAEIRKRAAARRVVRWGWALAAAAGVAMAIGVSVRTRPEKAVVPPVMVAEAPKLHVVRPDEKVFVLPAAPAKKKRVPKSETLMVKMLTDDPDVVIYWQIETKGGSE